MSKTSESSTKAAPSTEADVIWDQIKKVPVALFGLSANPLETLVKRVDILPDKVHLSLKAPSAAIAAIEDALNVRRDGQGGEVRVNSFEVEMSHNGMLIVGRKGSSK